MVSELKSELCNTRLGSGLLVSMLEKFVLFDWSDAIFMKIDWPVFEKKIF